MGDSYEPKTVWLGFIYLMPIWLLIVYLTGFFQDQRTVESSSRNWHKNFFARSTSNIHKIRFEEILRYFS